MFLELLQGAQKKESEGVQEREENGERTLRVL
jgi:hypothetical protein